MNFWERVDEELSYLGKSRKELAGFVGCDTTNISFGIKKNSVPSADIALRAASFLGVSLEYLLGIEDEDFQKSENKLIKQIDNKLLRFSEKDLNVMLSVADALDEKY